MGNKTILMGAAIFFSLVFAGISIALVDAVTAEKDNYHQAEYMQELLAAEQFQQVQLTAQQTALVEIDTSKEQYENETDEEDLNKEELANIKTEITQEQAIAIALQLVSGKVTDIEIEKKQGHEVYAVEIDDDGDEVDVFVDVKTGQVIGAERDSEEDEKDEDDDEDEEDDD